MRISDWSSDVCSSDLELLVGEQVGARFAVVIGRRRHHRPHRRNAAIAIALAIIADHIDGGDVARLEQQLPAHAPTVVVVELAPVGGVGDDPVSLRRSEEHTSELQSLLRISYAVFCLKKKNTNHHHYLKHY